MRQRLSIRQVEDGLLGGYVFLEEDPQDCRYRYGFEPLPHLTDEIYRLIIDTETGTLRPITAFPETNEDLKTLYLSRRGGGYT